MNANKITVPQSVANAIAHYVALADTKTEALLDITRLDYEAERSELILRHFDGDYDVLMEALICGYEVEKTPEEKVRDLYNHIEQESENLRGRTYLDSRDMNEILKRHHAMGVAIRQTLHNLGIKISGVNAE